MTKHIPWYKNYILLLIIFIPLATVCGSITTIYLAVTNNESPVLEDYFKVGLSPQKQQFQPTDITAILSPTQGILTLQMAGESIEPLKLVMQHASKSEFDQEFTLMPTQANVYPLPPALLEHFNQATWYFYLSPVVGKWRIEGSRRAPKHGQPLPKYEKDIFLQQSAR